MERLVQTQWGRFWRLSWPALPGLLLVTGCSRVPPGVKFEVLADGSPPVVWPQAPEPTRIRYLASFAEPADIGVRRSFLRKVIDVLFGGSQGPRLGRPYGLAVDGSGRIYVADPDQSGIHLFDPGQGRHKFVNKSEGQRFRSPIGVATDGQGGIFVSDSDLGMIFALDEDWKERFRIEQDLERPTGLAFHQTHELLYVVDTHAHTVRVYHRDGQPAFSFGHRGTGDGELNFPTAITIGSDGNIYLSDSMNFRVQVFTPDGQFLSGFGRHGDAVGDLARPKGIATDSMGHIYVVEGLFDVVNIYNQEGRLLLTFGGGGRGPGQFWLATGLAIDSQNRIYVADSFNRRVQVFQYLPGPTP